MDEGSSLWGTQLHIDVPEYLICLFSNGTCCRAVRTNAELAREVIEFGSARGNDGVTVKSQRRMNIREICEFKHCGTPGNGGNETQQSNTQRGVRIRSRSTYSRMTVGCCMSAAHRGVAAPMIRFAINGLASRSTVRESGFFGGLTPIHPLLRSD
jgi:hypothetical protein